MNNLDTNKDKKIDRRVIKTKRAICNAFAELLSTKDLNEITIKNIADLADVDRKTVYNYYGGIHEILDEIENTLVESYEEIINGFDFKKELENPYKIFDTLTKVLNSNLDFYSRLLKINTNSQLIVKIDTALIGKVKETFIQQGVFAEDKVDVIATYVVTGMVAAYQYWFNSGRKQPLEEFSKDVSVLVLNGIHSLIQK